jgi:hypothetical protein
MTLGAGGDLQQHQSTRGKVRCGPSEEEKMAQRELTERGRLAVALYTILVWRWLSDHRRRTED